MELLGIMLGMLIMSAVFIFQHKNQSPEEVERKKKKLARKKAKRKHGLSNYAGEHNAQYSGCSSIYCDYICCYVLVTLSYKETSYVYKNNFAFICNSSCYSGNYYIF